MKTITRLFYKAKEVYISSTIATMERNCANNLTLKFSDFDDSLIREDYIDLAVLISENFDCLKKKPFRISCEIDDNNVLILRYELNHQY